MLNWLEIVRRLLARRFGARRKIRASSTTSASQDSAITDAYTSFFSGDIDGEMAELYFTNTGVALLAVSLTSSVVMNLFLPTDALNIIVACTFGLAWAVSLAVVRTTYHHTFPIMALRRAGRFIWSDTPFVNFFSLIYIATVLKGRSTLRLQDYVTFRSIAVLELVFMKAKLASARPESQITLMRTLIRSERVILHAVRLAGCKDYTLASVTERAIGPEESSLVPNPPDLVPEGYSGFHHFAETMGHVL